MTISYTKFNSDSIYHFSNEDDTDDAIEFLKDPTNFRAFHQGLSEIMLQKSYVAKSATPNEMAQVLSAKLTEIGSSLSLSTVNSWFTGEHRPKVEAGYRKQIYEICYALKLDLEETLWFFHHVYYDRAFNCHTIDESVFYYCFKNHISYKAALDIIAKIKDSPIVSSSSETSPNYTSFVQQRIEEIDSIDELISFLSFNRENFSSWNESAYNKLDDLVSKLLPTENGKNEIAAIKRKMKRKNSSFGLIPKLKAQEEWGLVMKEFFHGYFDVEYLDILEGKNIQSKNFLLEQILGMRLTTEKKKDRFIDRASIPDIVKNNFPSRKTMSDVLSKEKVTQSKSYDSIRKLIILLEFYRYWCEIKLTTKEDNYIDISLRDVFIEELNHTLYLCGHAKMYAGNPYDWIFMCSAQAEDPLSYFRQCITYLLDE